MKVKAVCDYYFNAFHSLSKRKEHNWKQNALDGLCVTSYFTLVVPIGFGIASGISKLHGRLTKKGAKSPIDQRVNDSAPINTPKVHVPTFDEYKKAADQGNTAGQLGAGKCYLYGNGVAKDYKSAVELFQKAADKGDAEAQVNLGGCLLHGRGIPKDEKAAVELFKLSAAQGNKLAMQFLCRCYNEGLGVKKDPKIAQEWFAKFSGQSSTSTTEATPQSFSDNIPPKSDLPNAPSDDTNSPIKEAEVAPQLRKQFPIPENQGQIKSQRISFQKLSNESVRSFVEGKINSRHFLLGYLSKAQLNALDFSRIPVENIETLLTPALLNPLESDKIVDLDVTAEQKKQNSVFFNGLTEKQRNDIKAKLGTRFSDYLN